MGEVISYLAPLNKQKLEKLQVMALLMSLKNKLRVFTTQAKEDKGLEALAVRLEELGKIHSNQLDNENLARGVYQVYMSEVMYIASLLIEESSPDIA